MSEKLGIIQTRGLGDNIIAMPIAQWFHDHGRDVYWPIDSRWVDAFSFAQPDITFIPVKHPNPDINPSTVPVNFLWNEPIELVKAAGCKQIMPLYMNVLQNEQLIPLERWTKFDEFKYAVSGVPFREKWNLKILRNYQREIALTDRIKPTTPYAIAHLKSTGLRIPRDVAERFADGLPVVEIDERTDNPFDWLGLIEGASKILCVDSAYANLIEQLNMGPDGKVLFLRSDIAYTPVFMNGWNFAWMKEPDRVLPSIVYNLNEMERKHAAENG